MNGNLVEAVLVSAYDAQNAIHAAQSHGAYLINIIKIEMLMEAPLDATHDYTEDAV